MYYVVKKGDSLWRIAARELGCSIRWEEIASINRLQAPYLLFVGQTLTLPELQRIESPVERGTIEPTIRPVSPKANLGPASSAIRSIATEIDRHPELHGTGIVLQFPAGQTFQLRPSRHASDLETIIVAKLTVPEPADEPSWWERWNGVVLNCGGAAISWVALGAAAAAEVPSLGGSTPLAILSWTSAAATTTQCGLAFAKETSTDFAEYLQTDDGQWVNIADVALDIISLATGVKGAITAVKASSQLMKTSRYARYLNAERKGKLLKVLQRIEKQEKDLAYFRQALEKLKATGKVLDPAGRGISNNLLKRGLPYMTRSLQRETLASVSSVIAAAATTTASYYGGVGSQNLGLIKVTIGLLQERIDRAP